MTTADNAEEILGTYKKMMADCQQIAAKVSEVRHHQCNLRAPLMFSKQLRTLFAVIFGKRRAQAGY